MYRLLFIILTMASILFCPALSTAQEVKYWKYKLNDMNWFPVYKNELPGPEANKKTYWKVTYDSNNRPVVQQRIVRGFEDSHTVYEYPNSDLPTKSVSYKNGSKIGHSVYEWDGPYLKRKIFYDTEGNETISYLYSRESDYYKSREFNKGKKNDEFYTWYVNDNNIIYKYIWNKSKNKYYVRALNEETGLRVKSDCYINDKLDFTQKFSYDETGVENSLTQFNGYGRQYAENIYEDGLRMIEKYNYNSGDKEVYEYNYGDDRICDFITCMRNDAYVYKMVFERDSMGVQ